MPHISIKAKNLSDKTKIKTDLGKAIEILPGKSENWLMVTFEEPSEIYFSGSDEPAAIAEVSLYGEASPSAYDRLTGEITRIISENSEIPKNRIYVKYSETEFWGYNGRNF